MPIDRVVGNSINEILNSVIMLSENIKDSNKTFKIYLKDYGKLNMSRELMNIIAEKLKERKGWTVNLKNPDIMVFLFIFNWGTILSLIERNDVWELNKFL
ncbi:MAG: THUMP domain-containing protein [Candidatus Bathyarchaeia archaeon]